MKRVTGLAAIFASGILAYLILAIMFWQSAWSAPLGGDLAGAPEQYSATLDNIYAGYKDPNTREVSSFWVVDSLYASLNAHAAADCRSQGKVDWSCQEARYSILYDYVVTYIEASLQDVDVPANAHPSEVVALSFLLWAIEVELDSETAAGTAAALWVIDVISVLEEQS